MMVKESYYDPMNMTFTLRLHENLY